MDQVGKFVWAILTTYQYYYRPKTERSTKRFAVETIVTGSENLSRDIVTQVMLITWQF